MTLRKIIKTRGSLPGEEAAMKLLYPAVIKVVARWETAQHWKQNVELSGRSLRRADPGGQHKTVRGKPLIARRTEAGRHGLRRLTKLIYPVVLLSANKIGKESYKSSTGPLKPSPDSLVMPSAHNPVSASISPDPI
jgi:hypothetical protein